MSIRNASIASTDNAKLRRKVYQILKKINKIQIIYLSDFCTVCIITDLSKLSTQLKQKVFYKF